MKQISVIVMGALLFVFAGCAVGTEPGEPADTQEATPADTADKEHTATADEALMDVCGALEKACRFAGGGFCDVYSASNCP